MHKTNLKDLSEIITDFNIPPGSTLMVHSSLLKFGIIEEGVKGILDCLMESLKGDFTMLMPAFTFSFSKSKYWHSSTSKSEMGVLTEYFRKIDGIKRTNHPFHSVSVYGKNKEDFSLCDSTSSFGKGSPFEKLINYNAYNLSLGTEFIGGATYVHHTEEMAKVPYRYYKYFEGTVINSDNVKIDKTYKMYVRKINKNSEWDNNWEKIFEKLCKDNCFKVRNLNGAKIMLSSIPKTDSMLKKYIDKDAYIAAHLLKK